MSLDAMRRPLQLFAVVSFVMSVLALTACADRPVIWFENTRDEAITVSIDGDRLVLLRPHHVEYLPYSTAAWAWPRRVDIAVYQSGERLSSSWYDADDLARQRWTIVVGY
jgi:hypothetical protein